MKRVMTKAKKVTLIVFLAIAAAAIIAVCAYFVTVHCMSKRYNLIKVDTSSVCEPSSETMIETDVELSFGKMHYAKIGSGEQAVILVHGNGSNHTKLASLGRYLANSYTVYLPDSRNHGQSDSASEISYKLISADLVEFAEKLNIEKPIVIGHSDGGIVAINTAIEYPDFMKAFVSFGANSHPSKFKAYFTIGVKIKNAFKHSILNDMMLNEPNFTPTDLAKIRTPAFIVAGEFDIMYLSDTAYIANNIKDSEIAIIQGANHSNYVHDGKKSYAIVKPFLDRIKGAE
ncbi:MAG: alpha/beta hydrolase [Eubacteriales bacterium]|nr:alpha/beta hydrolase [Eubacteriales bacterium]